ncbi:MAG: ferritin-like domain-containing protein [Flavitalea sp.]
MNLENILNHIETVDPEIHERLDTRRKLFKNFAGFGTKLAAAAVPIAFGSLLNKSYGQAPPAGVLDVLNFALLLEYLEAGFYEAALKNPGMFPSAASRNAITTIGLHEKQHVDFLKAAISGAGGTPIAKPNFDLSGGGGSGNGPFKDATWNYRLFLSVAQTLEDTGVRAYKGQAGNLKGTGAVLTAALNIHSVEARHASHIRQMRQNANFAAIKPWITGKNPVGLESLVQANYNGEELTMQAGIEIININGKKISFENATESFDEPLTKEQVTNLVKGFIAA